MLNVKTLTDTMSRMELPQLQQYAALHKNDPYIVTLALSIANQKKQMKAAQDGQAGMQPQPTVVDQDIFGIPLEPQPRGAVPPQQQMAQALPEDQGIGTLPAQNMQNFAGGGIVAFGGGGDVPGYAEGVFTGGTTARVGQLGYEQLVKLFQTDPELARQAALRAGPAGERFLEYAVKATRAGLGAPATVAELGTMASIKANRDVAKMTPEQRAALSSNPMLSAMSGDAGLAAAIQNAPGTEKPAMGYGEQMGNVLSFLGKTITSSPADKQNPKGYGLTRLLADDPPVAASKTAPAPAAIPYDPATAIRRDMFVDPAAPPAPIGGKRQPPSSAGAPALDSAAPTGTTPSGLATLNTKPMSAEEAMAAAGKFGDDTAMRAELQGYVDRQKKVGDDSLASFQQGIAGLPEAYKKYEARLQKEEAEAATDKDKAVGMSIFKAGLAMMSGTSQNAFENIGKGAMVGLEDQQAALKDFKKAQRERDKAFADIEAARVADQRGDLKTKLELESRAADRTSNAEGKMVEGIAKLFDTNKTNARGIYQTGVEQANQNQRTMYTTAADMQKQSMSDTAAMERIREQVAGSIRATQINAETYKLPMLYKSVEDSVDKMLQADINYKAADEATKTTMRNNALQKRLRATPGLAQYADATTGGGSAPGLRYNPQTGKIE